MRSIARRLPERRLHQHFIGSMLIFSGAFFWAVYSLVEHWWKTAAIAIIITLFTLAWFMVLQVEIDRRLTDNLNRLTEQKDRLLHRAHYRNDRDE